MIAKGVSDQKEGLSADKWTRAKAELAEEAVE
jgi:hypothetical protein